MCRCPDTGGAVHDHEERNGWSMKRTFTVVASIILFFFASSGDALTPDQIVKLKNAGVSDDTIQLMLAEGTQGVREVTDENGNTYIKYSTGSSSRQTEQDRDEEEKVRRAWKMLENILIDARQ